MYWVSMGEYSNIPGTWGVLLNGPSSQEAYLAVQKGKMAMKFTVVSGYNMGGILFFETEVNTLQLRSSISIKVFAEHGFKFICLNRNQWAWILSL